MKSKHLVCLVVAGLCMFTFALPPAHYAATKSHWALSTLENLQARNLLLYVSNEPKKLNGNLTSLEFENMLNDIWQSELTVNTNTDILISTDDKSLLTRKEAAERIFKLFNRSADGKTDAITWIKSVKIMSGYPSGDFKAADHVTLAQGVSIMSNLKNYLANHPEVKIALTESQGGIHQKEEILSYTAAVNTKGTVDFTLSWGEKRTGGYSVKITKVAQSGKELRITYRLTSPGPNDIVTQALTYPKDSVTLEMGMEAYKQLIIILVEDKSATK